MERVRIGILGCGDVAFRFYLPAMRQLSDRLELVATCDRDRKRAERAKEEYGAQRSFGDVDAMLDWPEVEGVVVLTPIASHGPMSAAALKAGKHVFVEKTMAVDLAQADLMVDLSDQAKLVLACAPSTILTSAFQRVKKVIESGDIGRITFAHAYAAHGGPARWDVYTSDPAWFYQKGGGPLFDLAPYPVQILTHILGPVRRVTAFSGLAVPEVLLQTHKMSGKTVKAQVDDSIPMILDFGEATFATVDVSYNMRSFRLPAMQFWGTRGGVTAPKFSGDEVGEWYEGDEKWEVTHLPPTVIDSLGIAAGVPHWVDCIRSGGSPLNNARHGRHVLEVLLSAEASARTGRAIELTTTF